MTYPPLARTLPATLVAALTMSGCSLSDQLVQMAIDAAIDEMLDDVDPPEPSRTELKWLALDLKVSVLELLRGASDTATEVQRELEQPAPDIERAAQSIEGLIDLIDRIPVGTYLERVGAWYARQSPAVQRRFWAKMRTEDDDDDDGVRAWEEAQKKANAEFMEALALDPEQRRRAEALIAEGDAEQRASDAKRRPIIAALDQELDRASPDGAVVFELVGRVWATIDLDLIRGCLRRWVGYYRSLRPDQKSVVHRHFAERLDDLPRLSPRPGAR